MKTPHRIAISVALILISGALAYWATTRLRARPPHEETPPAEQGTQPEAALRAPELRHIEDGKLAWKIILEEVDLHAGGSSVAARSLTEGIVFDGPGNPALRVTAKQVRGDTAGRNFEVTGDVVVTSPKGFVITTDRVRWINDEQRLHCPGVVVMRARTVVISTTTLDYHLATETVTCPNQVRTYSGNNVLVGRSLTYNVETAIVDMAKVQMVINTDEGRDLLKELRNP